jgi:hypothetical protein
MNFGRGKKNEKKVLKIILLLSKTEIGKFLWLKHSPIKTPPFY